MMGLDNMTLWFLFLLVVGSPVCFYAIYKQEKLAKPPYKDHDLRRLQAVVVVVYWLLVSSDSLQSPYLFKLFSYYGLGKEEIGFLFILMPVVSATFGTVLASLGDVFGRKRLCIMMCFFGAGGSMLKYLADYSALVFSQALSAIASVILATVFEAWLMRDLEVKDKQCGLTPTLSYMYMATSFSRLSWTLATPSLMSVWTYLAPFHLSPILLLIGAVIILVFFSDDAPRRVQTKEEKPVNKVVIVMENFGRGWVALTARSSILMLGVTQSTFEGLLIIVTLTWKPSLEESAGEVRLNLTLVYCMFMMSSIIGAALVKLLSGNLDMFGQRFDFLRTLSSRKLLLYLMLATTVFFALIVVLPASQFLTMSAFMCLHLTAGIYFPVAAGLRYKAIPDELRVVVTNYLRIPQYVISILVYLNVGYMSNSLILVLCTSLLAICSAVLYLLPIQDTATLKTKDTA